MDETYSNDWPEMELFNSFPESLQEVVNSIRTIAFAIAF